jgi:hypothetical protein
MGFDWTHCEAPRNSGSMNQTRRARARESSPGSDRTPATSTAALARFQASSPGQTGSAAKGAIMAAKVGL